MLRRPWYRIRIIVTSWIMRWIIKMCLWPAGLAIGEQRPSQRPFLMLRDGLALASRKGRAILLWMGVEIWGQLEARARQVVHG